MRLLLVAIRNSLALLWSVWGLFFRLPRWLNRPRFVYFKFKNDIGYRGRSGRRWPFRRSLDRSVVTSLKDFSDACELLGKDSNIQGIVLEIEDFEATVAKQDAIVESLRHIQKAGKKVIGYSITCDTSGYALLCACDVIWMAPAGRLELTGFSASAFTLGSLFKKYGIQAQFVRRGEHKTAPEMFTHDEVSPIQRQTLEKFLDERCEKLLDVMVQGRGVSRDEARARLNSGPYSARRALREGLIDQIVSPSQLDQAILGVDDKEIANYEQWKRSRLIPPGRFASWKKVPCVSVVSIEGMITQGSGGQMPVGPRVAGSDFIIQALKDAEEDVRSQGILLYINSPGGSAIASELILEEVRRVGKTKPIVAFMDRVAASGGYMAALGAREMWSSSACIVGSIGVFAGKFDVSKVLHELGVSTAILSRGENAGIYTPLSPFSESQRAALESDVEETYQVFLEMVAESRKKSKEEVHHLGEGRVYSGNEALKAGLVDRVGAFESAARRSLELADIRPAKWNMIFHSARHYSMPWMSLLQKVQHEQLFALMYPFWRM